ncbi:MAG: hypothetical protein GF398_02270 [Chitinivibrionales bacterium]|nr:hypothetical protein [Chitinivibrionales bacterium]
MNTPFLTARARDATWSHNRLRGIQNIFARDPARSVCISSNNKPAMIYQQYQAKSNKECGFGAPKRMFIRWSSRQLDEFVREIRPVFDFSLPIRILPRAAFRRIVEDLCAVALG